MTPPAGANLEDRVAAIEDVVCTRLAGELVAYLEHELGVEAGLADADARAPRLRAPLGLAVAVGGSVLTGEKEVRP